ncbi:Hpt domain-containing protein [Algoriphagus sp. NF]|jgi:FOG: HPt domain|uniref:Hpt domain-containing protein n=1 Tax=Algoriphagus marincola TaxID=264027 RepID=A0ABS7N139_9BACT|nr:MULTISPECIES: Hpt domain-containing protein [Algoriphagus]MBY5950041.1 Hpt domain-containing protein [Algoriphagus marincola]MDE0561697.1 Hpt domain-containing protein [Algoriphagus sp. NF]
MYQYISEASIYQYFGDDDPEMIRDMIQIILDTNVNDLQELPKFLENGDFETIKKRCHKAKPSMSYIGAMKTRKLLEKIEENLENSKEEIDELHGHMDEIKRELLDFLKEKT